MNEESMLTNAKSSNGRDVAIGWNAEPKLHAKQSKHAADAADATDATNA